MLQVAHKQPNSGSQDTQEGEEEPSSWQATQSFKQLAYWQHDVAPSKCVAILVILWSYPDSLL